MPQPGSGAAPTESAESAEGGKAARTVGPFHFLCIKVSKWRGRYHRILRLSRRDGISTLDPSKGAAASHTSTSSSSDDSRDHHGMMITNSWSWPQVAGCAASRDSDEEIVVTFAEGSEPALRLLVAPTTRATVLEAFYLLAAAARI